MVKKFLILSLCVLFVGCAILNEYVGTDSGALVVKKAGRIAGIAIGFEKPEDINKIIEYCDKLLLEKDIDLKEVALQKAYAYLYERYATTALTAALMAEVTDIIGIVLDGAELNFLENYDFTAMDMFVEALRNGLAIASPKYKKLVR
ncbi:MAG: hypothetical protein ACERKJ_11110 [Candidatus Dadabacteria bacterium]